VYLPVVIATAVSAMSGMSVAIRSILEDERRKMTMKVLLEKMYCPESICDIEQDLFDAMEGLPADEHGFAKGDFHVKLTFEEDS
jgi:hypothetical protein